MLFSSKGLLRICLYEIIICFHFPLLDRRWCLFCLYIVFFLFFVFVFVLFCFVFFNYPVLSMGCQLLILCHMMYKGHPRPHLPPRVMVSSAMGLKLGILGFYWPCTQKTNAKPMRLRSLRTMRHVRLFYLRTQTAVDAGDIHTWQTAVILITGKPRRPPIWAPCGNKNGAGSGISVPCISESCALLPLDSLSNPDSFFWNHRITAHSMYRLN